MAITGATRYEPIWRLFKRLRNGGAEGTTVPPPNAEDPTGAGIISVGAFNKIRIRVFGTDAANETGDFDIWGWHEDGGPAQKVVSYNVTLGALANHDFTSAGVWRDPDIRAQFTGTVFEVDTYSEQFDENGRAVSSTQVVDGANFVDLDLTGAQYHWLYFAEGTSTAAKIGAIWVPIQIKKGFGPLDLV